MKLLEVFEGAWMQFYGIIDELVKISIDIYVAAIFFNIIAMVD